MFYCCLQAAYCRGHRGGMLAADALAVRQWWFEERRLVLCRQVKTVMLCESSLSQIEDFQRSLKVLICCVGSLHL